MAGLVGEVLYCGEETDGQLVTMESFNGKLVLSLGGGETHSFVVEANGGVSQIQALGDAEDPGLSLGVEDVAMTDE
jgi:hypothetical protein